MLLVDQSPKKYCYVFLVRQRLEWKRWWQWMWMCINNTCWLQAFELFGKWHTTYVNDHRFWRIAKESVESFAARWIVWGRLVLWQLLHFVWTRHHFHPPHLHKCSVEATICLMALDAWLGNNNVVWERSALVELLAFTGNQKCWIHQVHGWPTKILSIPVLLFAGALVEGIPKMQVAGHKSVQGSGMGRVMEMAMVCKTTQQTMRLHRHLRGTCQPDINEYRFEYFSSLEDCCGG